MNIVIRDIYKREFFEIPLFTDVLDSKELCKNAIVYEDRLYDITIELPEVHISSVCVYVGDVCLKTSFNEMTSTVTSVQERIFEDCYDLAKIKIEVTFEDDTIQVFETPNISVAIKKTTSLYIEKMLQDIENNYSGILSACFSKSKKKMGYSETTRGINETLQILANIYTTFKEVYPLFQRNTNKRIGEEKNIEDGVNAEVINNDTAEWLMRHPEYIRRSLSITPIKVGQRFYRIDKVNVSNKSEKRDTYENQVILGFLKLISDYLLEMVDDTKKVIGELGATIPEELKEILSNDYELAHNCVLFYYREILRKLQEYKKLFEELYEAYILCLECAPITITSVPRYTFAFRQRYQYRRCFEDMVLWFQKGSYGLQSLEYFAKIKKLSTIFEYYTLLKLREGFEKNGFTLVGEPVVIHYESEASDIDNYYCYNFNNGEILAEIYYEPYIYSNKIVNNLNLYSTGFNFDKMIKTHRVEPTLYWKPDFVIKIQAYEREVYFILDSKFSKYKTVKEYHIVSLANKYILNIACRNKYYSEVLGVWAVYPALEENRMNMKKNEVNSTKPSLPIVAIEPLLTTENALGDWVKKAIKLCNEYNNMNEPYS